MPTTLEGISQQISDLLQQYENSCRNIQPDGLTRLRFPRGRIRRADTFRKRINFIKNPSLKSNIAYSRQLMDVVSWLMERFDLRGIAQEMLIKTSLVILASFAEVFVRQHLNMHNIKPNKKFKKNIEKLHQKELIDAELIEGLHSLREKRDNIHLDRIQRTEFGQYNMNDYKEALEMVDNYESLLRISVKNRDSDLGDDIPF